MKISDKVYKNPFGKMREEFIFEIIKSIDLLYHLKYTNLELFQSITIPKSEYGDIASSISFRISKEVKETPSEVAEKIAKAMQPIDGFANFMSMSGYINAFFNINYYSDIVINSVNAEKENYGKNDLGNEIKVIIEFMSVNPNKPLHIGHLRNALIGDSIARIMEFSSYNVERINYIDDLGLQCAESLWGYMNISNNADKKFDLWLGEQYVKVNERMEDPKVKKDIENLLIMIENSNSDEAKLNREVIEKCVIAQYETAHNYRIIHDLLVWESDMVREKIVERALEMGKLAGILSVEKEGKYKGCLIFDTTGIDGVDNEEPKKVLLRSNGTATYIAKDYAFHLWKLGILENLFLYNLFKGYVQESRELYTTSAHGSKMEFGDADVALNVIGSAQKLQQNILMALISSTPSTKKKKIMHISYGEVGIEGGTLSGRKGGWIGKDSNYTADDLMKQAANKAAEIFGNKQDVKEIEKEVALGAIRFEFLKFAPEKTITFSWGKALSFNGDSGPYCMYTHARASKILMKEAPQQITDKDISNITRGADFEVLRIIGLAPEYVEKACRENRVNVITEYLIELSYSFSKFYENMPILSGGEAKNARLAITSAAKQTIANMLGLLGISAPDNM
jgi:arginyl-tRNA synthetase